MTDVLDPGLAAGQEALDTLRQMLMDEQITAPARVSAAKALLDRFSPKEDAELKQREADERAKAIAEARCLLAEFALAKSTGVQEPAGMDQESAPEPTDAARPGTDDRAFDVIN